MLKSRTALGLNQLEAREVPAILMVGNQLQITGSDNTDHVTIERTYTGFGNEGNSVKVRRTEFVPGQLLGVFVEQQSFPANSVASIWVDLKGGSDVYNSSTGTHPATVYGGTGDDILIGGSGGDWLYGQAGNDVLVGRDGNDFLSGGDNKDILIGGDGADQMYGGLENDVLIGGYTIHDTDTTALRALRNEWARESVVTNPVQSLMNGGGLANGYRLNGGTVFDDGDRDTLSGGDGQDWFLADNDGPSSSRDLLTDKTIHEQVFDIDPPGGIN
jgi:Ca2+-binding RTX toxin-like protein